VQKKNLFSLLSILFWGMFVILSFIVIDITKLSTIVQYVLSGVYLVILIFAIVFTVKAKHSNTKKLAKDFIDENVLEGRRVYKRLLRKQLKSVIIWSAVIMAIIAIPIVIYSFIKMEKLFAIILTCSFVLGYCLVVLISYIVGKFSFFPYAELIFNKETFVMFASKSSIWGYHYDPTFHVIYNCQEYTRCGRVMWIGTDLGDAVLSSVIDVVNWFNDKKFSNFIRIDVVSKQGENIQCVYKIGRRKFLVSSDLDKLSGCFETSRSQKSKFKNKKNKK